MALLIVLVILALHAVVLALVPGTSMSPDLSRTWSPEPPGRPLSAL